MATHRASRRRLLTAIAGTGAGALSGCSGGGGSSTPTTTMSDDFSFETPAFANGGSIPERYTCDGRNVSPALLFGGVPSAADTLAMVVDDPDASNYTHWLLWNLPAKTESVAEDVPRGETLPDLGGARQGTNDADVVGYSGPCPPEGDGAHTYRFRAYAVSGTLDVPGGAGRSRLVDALEGQSVGTSRFTGEYDR